ncbi:MAG TPA: beta-ketoacyl-ACP synthase III [Planctomycetaceae bacterium]|nr:beta-ketoacyl-ACP synthase III [Planctomycetaceae bacterium]
MHQSTVRVDGMPDAGPTDQEISQLRNEASQQPAQHVPSTTECAKAGVFTLRRKTCSLMGVQIVGTGSYVPENVVTNADLLRENGFDPDWIEQRSGILERRRAPADLATSDLCVEAGKRAMAAAGVRPKDIDLLIVGTFTPDHFCPSTACLVQDRLGLAVPAFDLSAACSGFMYALSTAAQFVATGNATTALALGADTNTRFMNPVDQRTFPLFGDGAGAAVVTKGTPQQGLLCYQLGADGSGGPLLVIPAGGTREPATHEGVAAGRQYVHMDGRSVFKWAVRALTDTIQLVLEHSNLGVNDVSLYLLHQANQRIIDAAVEALCIPRERIFNNIQRYGNTSGASVPIALDEAFRAGRIHPGDTLLLSGFGAGLTWGTAIFRW